MKLTEMQQLEISSDDVQISKLKALDEDVIINIYYTPRVLTNNSLIFDKEVMLNWWTEGYEYAKEQQCKTFCLSKGKKPKLV